MNLRDYLRVLAKHWVGIIVFTLVGVLAGAAYTFTAPKVFTATSQTFISVASTATGGAAVSNAMFTQQRIASYLQIVTSPGVLQPVIDELGLSMSVQALAGRVTAENPSGTVLITISATDGDPQQAAAIANAAAVQLGVAAQALEASVSTESVPVKVTVTTPAIPPGSPSSPQNRRDLLLGLLIGFGLGVAYAFVREAVDTTVKSPDELIDMAGSTPLGVVAYDPDAKERPLVSLEQRATRAEAFRTIRTNLQYVDVDNPPKVVAITSAVPGEGKTTTAINLAITLAQTGKKVVLVETDLRRPKASLYLGVESELGLTDVLAGQTKLEDALIAWNRGLLTFLPAGHTPPNPSELLASKQFGHVLETLRGQFDHVIVDATPLLPVTDGAIVSKAADGALLIVRFGKTTREQVATSIAALQQVDARLLGTALNFVPTGRRGYGYKYGYKYGYGYGATGYESDGSHRKTSADNGV